jgi:hypothetical protein
MATSTRSGSPGVGGEVGAVAADGAEAAELEVDRTGADERRLGEGRPVDQLRSRGGGGAGAGAALSRDAHARDPPAVDPE